MLAEKSLTNYPLLRCKQTERKQINTNHRIIMKIQLTRIFLFTALLIIFIGCKSYPDNYQPKDLEDAIEFLDYKWNDIDKQKFQKTDEESATVMLHFGTGMYLRNNWGLWDSNSQLSKYFESIGIFHPDDMSSIILTSFHRHLNNKNIDLQGQIKYYKDYWNKGKEAYNIKQKEIIEIYKQFKIGDKITVIMQVNTTDNEMRAIGNPGDWTVKPEKDLIINGTLLDKFKNKNNTHFFKIKINKMNRSGIPTIYDVLKINQIVDFELNYCKFKK